MKNKVTKAVLWIALALVLLYVGYAYLGSAGEEPTAQEELTAEGMEPETKPASPKPAGVKLEFDDCMLSGSQIHGVPEEPSQEEPSQEESSVEESSEEEPSQEESSVEEPSQEPVSEEPEVGVPAEGLDPDGTYTSCEDVALYLETYGELPGNFITKKEAQALGWEGGSLEPYAPGKCIGGDKFGNYEGVLPKAKGRVYHECDIDTLGKKSRGAKRIVYSSDGLIYYTEDHYESFTLLYD